MLYIWKYETTNFSPLGPLVSNRGTSKWLNWNKSYYTETLKKQHFQILWAPSFQTGMGRTSIFNPRLHIVRSKNHCVEISWKSVNWNKSYCKETDDNDDRPIYDRKLLPTYRPRFFSACNQNHTYYFVWPKTLIRYEIYILSYRSSFLGG